MPQKGLVVLEFPSDWAVILSSSQQLSRLGGSFSNSVLTQSNSYDSSLRRLTVTIDFQWPVGTTLTLELDALTNPTVSKTGIFKAFSYYDSVLLDSTDTTDSTLVYSYSTYTNSLSVNSASFAPSN